MDDLRLIRGSRAGRVASADRRPRRRSRRRDAVAIAGACQIARQQYGTIVQLLVAGELDLASAPHLYRRLVREQREGAEAIVVDPSAVTFMDSTSLHALVEAHQADRERLRIILSPPAARLIDLLGFRRRLPIIEG